MEALGSPYARILRDPVSFGAVLAGVALAILAIVAVHSAGRAAAMPQLVGVEPVWKAYLPAILPNQPPPPADTVPSVEAMEIATIDLDDARAINAAIPFVKNGVTPARAFRFMGDEAARARAIDCLAAAQLYEAGRDAPGQRAVAQVVLNRARHPAFPSSVCGVVFQGSERRTGCQFTFTCDGSLRRRYSDGAWEEARAIAANAIGGETDRSVGLATHYHTDWVVPYWSGSLDKIARQGTHLFFRWKGHWGTPRAFRGQGGSNEPVIASLGGYSPAHRTVKLAAGEAEAEAALSMLERKGSVPAAPVTTSIVRGDTLFVAAPASATPASLVTLATGQCGAREYCKLFGWTDAAALPKSGELDAASRRSMSFSYLRDSKSGFERALFNCAQFTGLTGRDCMKR